MSSIDCGKFIAELRKNKRITQTELADLLKVSNSAISRWETGEGYPDISIFPRLAEILNVTVDELLKGKRESKDSNRKIDGINIRFKNASIGSLVLLVSAYLLFIAFTYSTYRVWYGVIGFIVIATVALMWFMFSRNYMMEACEYNDNDKRMIYNRTLVFYSVLITLFALLIPQIIAASLANIATTVMKLDYYVLWMLFISLVGLSTSVLIKSIHDKKISFKPKKLLGVFKTQEWIVVSIIMIATVVNISYRGTPQIVAIIIPLLIFSATSVYLYRTKKESTKVFIYRMSLPFVIGTCLFLVYISPYRPDTTFENLFEFFALYVFPILMIAYMLFILIISLSKMIKEIKHQKFDGSFELHRHFVILIISLIIIFPFSMFIYGDLVSLIICTLSFLVIEHYIERHFSIE